jgi:hypothetical protein
VGWLKSCMETLLQSWLSTHTGHSGPRRHVLTTTGSGDGGKAVHSDSEYLTGLDVTNPFFASPLSMDSMVDGRVWLPHGLFNQNPRSVCASIRFNFAVFCGWDSRGVGSDAKLRARNIFFFRADTNRPSPRNTIFTPYCSFFVWVRIFFVTAPYRFGYLQAFSKIAEKRGLLVAKRGFEPTILRQRTECSHAIQLTQKQEVGSPVGFEPTACRLTGECSNNLSAASGVAYRTFGAILTSLVAPNPAPKSVASLNQFLASE